MSGNHLSKINPVQVGRAAVLVVLVALVSVNARVILENLLRTGGIDEQIVTEANPRLNRQLLSDANELLTSFSSEGLTSIFPFDTLEEESKAPESQSAAIVEIQNASGIAGAATDLAARLEELEYQIGAISTAPSLQSQTAIIYKAGRENEAGSLVEFLQSEGWPVGPPVEAEITADIRIILGK